MADWVLPLCEREALDDAKRQHVGTFSKAIADSLQKEILACISVYNERHPQHPVPSAAVNFSMNGQRGAWILTIQKVSDPAGSLTIHFPINEAKLNVTLLGRSVTYLIQPEVSDGFIKGDGAVESIYFVSGENSHRVPDLVKELLSPLLFPQFHTAKP
jgi:hypothetical protein